MSSERTLAWFLVAIGTPSIVAGTYLTATSGEFSPLVLTGLGANTIGLVLLEESETTTADADDPDADDAA